MNSNPWFGVSMVLIGLIVGYGLATIFGGGVPGGAPGQLSATVVQAPEPSQPLPPEPEPASVKPVDAAGDHIRGNPNATVSVIEYSDFECPFCKRVHPTISQVLDEYGSDVNWVYRHYPLSFHANAEPAALASECVAEQGGNDAFWAFADRIFETQGEWAYETYVEELGLDVTAFDDCVSSEKYAERIQKDFSEGSAAGVRGTPGNIVLNNETEESIAVSGAQPFSAFQAAIDQLLGS